MSKKDNDGRACPLPHRDYSKVLLAHGGGGRLMHRLIEDVIAAGLQDACLESDHDAAVLSAAGGRLAMTTDSHVVDPIFFPGGDIGRLAVNGTVNDLAMAGARPLYLSTAFIIEEGLPVADLVRIVESMRQAAGQAGVHVVTGDTKVVERGRGHRLFITTAGMGILEHELKICPAAVRPGDAIIINGDIGRHGMAVMAAREGLGFESAITSDCAPLAASVLRLIEAGIEVHCLRDLTRGGLATALTEIAESSGYSMEIEETGVRVQEGVRGACELLGLDPLYVANEGRFIVILPEVEVDRALASLRDGGMWPEAGVIGRVTDRLEGRVSLAGPFGAARIVDMLSGEQLPRIC